MDRRMIATEKGNKEYYINSVSGNINITDQVNRKGYILIDDNKIWNPNPLMLTDNDYAFIVQQLPHWFAKKPILSQDAKDQLSHINVNNLKNKLRYVFTHFFYDEEDVYLLKLKYGDKTYRIYIGKRPIYYNTDEDAKFKTLVDDRIEKNKLMYPFEDEEWNRNFYETKEEYLKMREKEEEGYNKYFSN